LELAHRQSESERIARLYNMKTVPQSQLDNVKYDFETAGQKLKLGGAKIAKVRALLKETRLIAPFDAFIISRQAEIGQLAHPGDGLLVLEDHNQLRFRTKVKERDIPHIAVGQIVYVTIDALDDLRLECRVNKIIPSGSTNHTFVVETTLPRHDKLYPGMFGKANFTETMSFSKSRLPSIVPDGPASAE
jgi:membrane fusion protein, multidrug efflux system